MNSCRWLALALLCSWTEPDCTTAENKDVVVMLLSLCCMLLVIADLKRAHMATINHSGTRHNGLSAFESVNATAAAHEAPSIPPPTHLLATLPPHPPSTAASCRLLPCKIQGSILAHCCPALPLATHDGREVCVSADSATLLGCRDKVSVCDDDDGVREPLKRGLD